MKLSVLDLTTRDKHTRLPAYYFRVAFMLTAPRNSFRCVKQAQPPLDGHLLLYRLHHQDPLTASDSSSE
jgi:hypothetical protein